MNDKITAIQLHGITKNKLNKIRNNDYYEYNTYEEVVNYLFEYWLEHQNKED